MPVTAAIKFTQGVTTDDPGRALIGVTGVSVAMTNGDNSDVFDWTWETLAKPSASAIPIGVLAAGAVPSATFTPDVAGSYLARLTVKDTVGNQSQDTRAFIVREASGRIIPPFRGDSASLNYGGQAQGWDPAMATWLHATDGKAPLVNASTGAINNIASADLVDLTAAEGIRFTNGVGPTINGIASGYGGRRLYVMAAASAIVLANQNAGSVAANRIVTGTGANETLQAGSIAWLVYDAVDLRWRLQPIASGGGVPAGRTLTAGTGLTGGGDLSADRTFNVAANADGSIIANANDIQVGILATDVQHGVRGGGTQHAVVIAAGAAGFMSGADKTKLDGLSSDRLTALDANHLHAWELDDASGNFVDTGSSASPVNLTAAGTPIYVTPGIIGSCAMFGLDNAGATNSAQASVLVSAFADLPTGSVSLEFWFRTYIANLGFLAGVESNGGETFCLNGNSAAAGQIGATVRADAFKNSATIAALLVSSGFVWHHLMLVYDSGGGNDFVYLDGEIVLKQTGQSGPVLWTNGVNPAFSIALGLNSSGQFRGQMSRVRLSDIARSQAYARAVYKKGMLYP